MTTNLAESNISIVSVAGPNISKCGYCKGRDCSHTFGMWAHFLTCEDYQELIDRGWRRSGQYVYKPNLRTSCCPQYTIRLDANHFKTSKSQKKMINKFNRYIRGEWVPKHDEDENMDKKSQINSKQKKSEPAGNDTLPQLLARVEHLRKKEPDLVDKHELDASINMEASSFTKEKYALYCKYQIEIHHDPPSKLNEKSFRKFLVESPLKPISFDGVQNAPCSGYGSFHQMYRLDGQLIAVAVLDVLPNCVSSVYFMYDPAYSFLSLGKYSALREIALTQEFQEKVSRDLHWYYMGYYIHTCPKMLYKGQYKPSYLLDVEANTWEPIEKCLPLLDKSSFVPFHSALNHADEDDNMNGIASNANASIREAKDNVKSIPVIFSGMLIPITQLPLFYEDDEFRQEMEEYVLGVGENLAKKMLVLAS